MKVLKMLDLKRLGTVVIGAGMLIAANATQPPRLPTQPFVTLLVAFLVGIAIWAATLVRRFRGAP